MKRPALCLGLPFIAGLTAAALIGQRLPLCGAVLLAALAFVLGRRALWKYILLSTLSLLTACCVYWHAADTIAAQQARLGEQTVTFTGTVTAVRQYSGGYYLYDLKGTADGVPLRTDLLLHDGSYVHGDALTVTGTLTVPEDGYLYQDASFALSRGIGLRFGRDAQVVEAAVRERPTLRARLYRLRSRMRDALLHHMREETGAMLAGMLFGDTSALSRMSRTALYRMGIGHVMAVSGLHLDYLALCVIWLLERLRVGRRGTFLVTAAVCGTFVLFVGETFSVERACLMLLLSQGARLVFRRPDTFSSLSLAMLILGAARPFVILTAGFWLSCAGAFGIGVAAPLLTRSLPDGDPLLRLRKDLVAFCWTFAAVLPASLVFFREVSLLSPVSNALLVPFCLMAMGMGLIGLVLGGTFAGPLFLDAADVLCGHLLRISEYMSRLPWTHVSSSSEILRVLTVLGVLVLLTAWQLGRDPKRMAGLLAFVVAVTAVGVQAERYLTRERLYVALLGEKSGLVVLTKGREAVVLDMTGDRQAPQYAEAYLTDRDIVRVQTLLLPNEEQRRRWDERMAFFPAADILYDDHASLLFEGARVSLQDGTAVVTYSGETVCVTDDPESLGWSPTVLAVYGDCTAPVPDCGVLLLTDPDAPYVPDAHTYLGAHDIVAILAPDGTCQVRMLAP